MTRVARVSWRTVAAALPAVALVGSGLVLVATDGTPSTDVVAGSSPLVTVPRTAIQHPEAPALPALPELPAPLVDAADAECNIDAALLAAICKVESDLGRYGGNGVDANGTVRPGIYGIPLNGTNHTAVIRDTDSGVLDRDASFDRAVGPMQLIPGTWRAVGVDANGDGRKDPRTSWTPQPAPPSTSAPARAT